jgi:Calcium binding
MNTTQDAERDERITMEIIVDCYDEEEQMMGWYYYLDENMIFPFTAVCINKRSISPIHAGGKFEVVGMASADECEREMFVEIVWDCDTLAVPLSQLSAPDADAKTQEAIADWHYWIG